MYHEPENYKFATAKQGEKVRDNTIILQNHRMIRTAMKKKMMVLIANFARSPAQN